MSDEWSFADGGVYAKDNRFPIVSFRSSNDERAANGDCIVVKAINEY